MIGWFLICIPIFYIVTHKDKVDMIFYSVIISILLGFASTVIADSLNLYKCEEDMVSQDLVVMEDTSNKRIDSFLFLSSTEDEYIYRYIINTDKGKQVKELTNQNEEIYIEEGHDDAKLLHKTKRPKSFELINYFTFETLPNSSDYYVFQVPKNTIMKEYIVNLK